MVYVAGTASVDEHSVVRGDARVEGNAILDQSEMSGSAVLRGDAEVVNSQLKDNAQINEHAHLFWCNVTGAGRVYGNAHLEHVNVVDDSCVFGDAKLTGSSFFVNLRGVCKIGGSATLIGLKTFEDFVNKYGADKVELIDPGNAYSVRLIILTDVWDMG